MATFPPVFDPLNEQQQQPPPIYMAEQSYGQHLGHGSVGTVIGVLVVIAILGTMAVVVGRLCNGRGNQYDMEGWVETKCGPCIDGRVGPAAEAPPPQQPQPQQPATPVAEQHTEASTSSGGGKGKGKGKAAAAPAPQAEEEIDEESGEIQQQKE